MLKATISLSSVNNIKKSTCNVLKRLFHEFYCPAVKTETTTLLPYTTELVHWTRSNIIITLYVQRKARFKNKN
jgi:hypothetical protein